MSGTSRTFEARITVRDLTAAPLAAISARLRALSGMNGMQRLAVAAGEVGRQIGALAGTLAAVAVPAGFALGGLAVGMTAVLRGAVDAGGALNDLSERLGMSVEDIQGYGFAFEQAGVSSEQFTGAMEKLQRGIGQAAAGENQALAALFRRLGVSLRDANGQVRRAADVLPHLAQAFQRNENATVRTRMAMELFGRAGGPLIAALAQGNDALQESTARWRELNGEINSTTVKALDDLGDGMNEVRHALLGMRDAIAVRLAPVMAPLFRQLATWIASNRDLVATKAEEWITALADAVRSVDFAGLIESVRGFLRQAGEFLEAVGGWKTALIAVGAVMAGPMIVSIGLLAAALTMTLVPPLVAVTGYLARIMAFRLPAAVAGLLGGGGAAAGGAAGAGAAGAGAAAAGGGISGAAAAAGAAAATIAGAGAAGLAIGMALGAAEDPEIRRRSRARMAAGANGANRIEGWDDPDPMPAPAPLYRPQSAPAPAPPPPPGEVEVRVRFDNLPREARVDARADGAGVAQPRLDVGYATLGAP